MLALACVQKGFFSLEERGFSVPWLTVLSAPLSTELPGWESFFMSLTKSIVMFEGDEKILVFCVELVF